MRANRTPKRAASVRLPALRSPSMSRQLFTASSAELWSPTWSAPISAHGHSPCAGQHVRHALHRRHAEEQQHEHLAEPEIGERERPGGVGVAGDQRQHADDQDRHAAGDDQRDAEQRRDQEERAPRRASRGVPRSRPLCVTRVGPSRSAVSAPFSKSAASFTRFVPTWMHSADASARPARCSGTGCGEKLAGDADAEQHGRQARGERLRPRGQQPGRTTDSSSRGFHGMRYGSRGNFLKFGLRFSRYAFFPSCASSLM